MTTDYTSATINQNIKNAAAQGRKYQTAQISLGACEFNSVFENVSKNYTDKSEVKNQQKNDYAVATKTVNSAKKSAEAVKNNKTQKTPQTNNQTDKNITKQQRVAQNNTNNNFNNTTNVQQNSVTQNAETDNFEKSGINTAKQSSSNDTQVKSQETVQNDSTTVVNSSERKVINDSADVQNDTADTDNEVLSSVDEQETTETYVQITNEQMLANLAIEQSTFVVPELQAQQVVVQNTQSDDMEQDSENQSTESMSKTRIGEIIQQQTNIEEIALENAVKELFDDIQNTFPQTFNQSAAKADSLKNILNESSLQSLVNEVKQEILEKETYLSEADVEVGDVLAQDLDVELNKPNDIKNVRSDYTPRTAQESLAADTSRITLNLEEVSAKEDVSVLTPDQTQGVESDDVPFVQVTEEVAQSLNNFVEKTQNRDFAGKVKDKITAKLGEVLGTSTVITDVQNSYSMQSEMNSNSQGNNLLSQGNASEQAIKMSIQNISESETSVDGFITQIEAKLNAAGRTVELKQPALLNKSDILSQMNAKLNEMQQAGQSKVSIVLRPENLGRVSVQIMNTSEGIVAKMTTDNQQVRDLLDKNIEALRANLSSQGVNVNNIKVECSNQAENNAMDFERHQFEQQSQDFQGEQGHHRNANQSNKNQETTFWDNFSSPEEQEEASESTENIRNTETTKTIITHNGKINYKV